MHKPRMRKSKYVTLLLAGVAMTALSGCDQHDMTKDATLFSDPAACAQEMDAADCNKGFDAAKEEHAKEAPKYPTQADCEAAGFQRCEVTAVRNAEGGSSSFFMPMMMGYMMSRAFSGGGYGYGPGAGYGGGASRPVYADRNGYLYTGGTTVGKVPPGTTSLGTAGVPMRNVARGGFGASASRYSGGGS